MRSGCAACRPVHRLGLSCGARGARLPQARIDAADCAQALQVARRNVKDYALGKRVRWYTDLSMPCGAPL